ncbi:MAG: SixA phosphatase family protein, partial [Planctomycetota bacterium]
MKTLLLLRHAKSSHAVPGPDHDRPLNERGERDAPRMGQLLAEMDLLPDVIVCSTATRARSTAELLIQASGYEGAVQFSEDLYWTHGGPRAALEVLRDLPDAYDSVMLVG